MATAPRRGSPAPRQQAATSSLRGEAGRRRAEEEAERAKARAEQRRNQPRMPFRYYTPVGATQQIVVVDAEPYFFRYEHNFKDASGSWHGYCGCINETENCPACEALKREPYYALYLTVIDLTPFVTSNNEEIPFARKLLVVKPAQQKKFLRFFNKEGTLRGAIFDMTRDGDKDASIGNDIEFVEFMSEDDLLTYERSWTDRENKEHVELCHEVFDYDALFPNETADSLRAQFGGRPSPGSRAHDAEAIGGRATARGRPAPAGRAAPAPARGRAAPPEDDAPDWESAEDNGQYGDDDTQDAPPARGRAAPAPARGRAAPAPARGRAAAAPARRGQAEESTDDDYAEPGDDGPPFDADPPRRGRAAPAAPAPARGRAAPAASARRGRQEPVDDDPPPPPPRRPAPRR